MMKGYVTNIEDDTLENKDFRRVLYTGKNSQLVLMSLRPKEEIGLETHSLDQFIRVEAVAVSRFSMDWSIRFRMGWLW
jgi:mannose-6-phosphate isomerase-like protein (cupin superfamily)